MNGFTPGPWVAESADMFGDHNVIRGDGEEALAIAAVVSNMRPADEVAANARLIAAAPELLEAIDRYLAARKALGGATAHNNRVFDAAMAEHQAALVGLEAASALARGETA